jgi:hypothetical protein
VEKSAILAVIFVSGQSIIVLLQMKKLSNLA